MNEFPQPLVSIIIPHFRTPDLIRLCLRSIRFYTRNTPFEVLVVDNDSQDEQSLKYLRGVDWIRLIERTSGVGLKGKGHKEAIDIGIAQARGEYVLAFHSDSIPVRHDWLDWHLQQLLAEPDIGAVGTYKLELKPQWLLMLKELEKLRFWRQTRHDREEYIRSHCALYRKKFLTECNLNYDDPESDVAGRAMHHGLVRHGYKAKLLSIGETLKRVVHLNHGTMVMLPELGARKGTIRKGLQRIHQFLNQPQVQAIYHDESLDHHDELPGDVTLPLYFDDESQVMKVA